MLAVSYQTTTGEAGKSFLAWTAAMVGTSDEVHSSSWGQFEAKKSEAQ
jgi:hypothetical protein